MRLRVGQIAFLGMVAAFCWPAFAAAQFLPETIRAEGVPPIPVDLDSTINTYRFSDHVSFQGWLAGTRRVLYLSEVDGVEQAFVRSGPADPERQLTNTLIPVAWAYSHPNRERLVIATDLRGDERHQLALQNLATGQFARFANGRWDNEAAVWSRSGRVLALSSNARNGNDGDLYLISPPNLASGRLLKNGTGTVRAQSWSPDDRRLAAMEISRDWKSTRVHLIDIKTGQTETLPEPPGEPVFRTNVSWSPDGNSLYWLTTRDSDCVHLARYNLATATETRVTDGAPCDVERYVLSTDGTTALVVYNEDGRSRLQVIDPRTGRRRPTPRIALGQIGTISFRRNTLEFAFEWSSARSPTGLYSYDLRTGYAAKWVKPVAVGFDSSRVPGHALFRYPSFDGRLIPAYIRYPDRRFTGRRPVLVIIHGGPASQYQPGFSVLENYLVGELGIALVMPNVRGSRGYGRAYEKLDNGRHREDALRDLGALFDWIALQPELDSSRVAVSGGSHGGYLALSAMARYGDRLRGGIDIAGVSSLETSLQHEPPSTIDYWRTEYGDERDPEMRQFLHSASPLAHADKIKKPLLVAHGENDTRVRIGESDQIVDAVRRNGTDVWYIRFRGEGHNLQRREHRDFLTHAQIVFLKQLLVDN